MRLLFSKKCLNQIQNISDFIVFEIQMPDTAGQFINRMENFAFSLLSDYKAYKTCKFPAWERKGYQCAVFEKRWLFAFVI